jgi:cystathionine beta-lyase
MELANLHNTLEETFAGNFVLYYRAHQAHVNIVGRNFASDHKLLEKVYEYLQGNIDLACRESGTHLPLIGCTPPEATFLLWLDCRALSVPDATLHKLFADAGLGLSPGTQFGSEGSGFMRLNIALPRQQLATVMAQLRVALG